MVTKEGSHLYELEVRSKAQTRASLGGYIRLVTNHPKKPEITLPVQLRLRPELDVLPPEIAFGRVSVPSSGQRVTRAVLLVDNRGRAIHVRDLEYNKNFFQAAISSLGGGQDSRCRIEVEPRLDRLPAGNIRDTLIVKLEGSNTEVVKVPLSIDVRKQGQKSGNN